MTVQTFGKYQLLERIGRGGMGSVYRARDPILKRDVALKLISTIESDPSSIRRFEREAQAVARLNHPNIVVIHDFGYESETPFLVMEYLTGRGVDRTIRDRETIPIDEKLRLILDACKALAHAHTRGVFHRDIKPANVWITEQGACKILDFGIARITGAGDASTTQALGTPNYMSPEAVRGETVDARSDLFSLTATLYEWLTFEKPFGTGPLPEVLSRIVNEEPTPLEDRLPGCSVALSEIVRSGLQKVPDRRFANAATMAAALGRAMAAEGVKPVIASPPTAIPVRIQSSDGDHRQVKTPQPRRWFVASRRFLGIATVGFLALSAAVLTYVFGRQQHPPGSHDSAPKKITSGGPLVSHPARGATARVSTPASRGPVQSPSKQRTDGAVQDHSKSDPRAPVSMPEPGTSPRAGSREATELAPPELVREIVVPIGALLTVVIQNEIRSDRAQVGDEFEAVLEEPFEHQGELIAPRNSRVIGRVDLVGRLDPPDSRPFMLLSLVRLGDGKDALAIRTGGYRVVAPPQMGGSNIRNLIIGVGVGAGVGAVIHGGTGAVVGGAAGGVASTFKKDAPPQEFRIRAPLSFKLALPVVIRSKPPKET